MAAKLDMFDLWRTLIGNVNTQQGGHIKPQGNFQNWVNEISQQLFRDLIKKWENNQVLSDDLAPYLTTVNVTLSDGTNQGYDLLPFPDNYGYFSSCRVLVDESTGCGCMMSGQPIFDTKSGVCKGWEDPDYKEIRDKYQGQDLCEVSVTKIPNQQFGSACTSVFKKPTIKAPIITQFEGGFKVAPRKLGVLVLDYFKQPVTCVFGYTLGPNDEIIYNPATSVQPEWSAALKPYFLAELQKRYGMFVREDFVYSASAGESMLSK